jgi:Ala-tRNA(Pro) deacylase
MAVKAAVQEFLRRANVPYAVYPHTPAFTAADEADVMGVPERDWAKVVVCFADREPIQAVVPANYAVDLDRLRVVAGASAIRLADEEELEWLFPDCELGAMPPFGPMYRQRVFVDETLTAEDDIVFNAGTHGDAVAMKYMDFDAMTNPIVGRFARRMY